MELNLAQEMIDAAPVLNVALEKLTTGLRSAPRAAVRKAILHPGEAETPVVLLPPGDAPLVVLSGHATLMAAHCKGETHCECRIVAVPRADRGRGPLAWQPARDGGGCGLAALSTITGAPYPAVKSFFAPTTPDRGLTHGELDVYLAAHGLAVDRRKEEGGWDPWPPEPWGRVHVCMVAAKQNPQVHHWVTMLADGTVLDPADERPGRLADYERVYSVAAVVPAGR